MRTVIYARFSSDNQNPRSIADQIEACRQRCEREGWTIIATFQDAAISGAAGMDAVQRPGLNAMLALVEAGGIDQVLAESTDRIARHVADAHSFRERIEYKGCRLFTLMDGVVTPIVGLVKGFMDAQFRSDLAARVKRGQRGTIADGRSSGSVSYGYRRANRLDEKGDLIAGLREIDPDEAEVVRRIYREFVAGLSARSIAGRLNADGIEPPRAGYWHTSTILGQKGKGMGVLRNRLYVGELVYGRTKGTINPRTRLKTFRVNEDEPLTVQPVPHLRIIDQDLWDQVQASLASREGVRPERARRPKHLLSGKVVCDACGSNYVITGARNWICGRRLNGNNCTNGRMVATRKLERLVLADLKANMLSPEAVAEYEREYRRDFARKMAQVNKDKGRAERRLAEATRKMERLVEAFAQGGSEFAELRDMMAAARDEKEAAARNLSNIEALPTLALLPGLADQYRREVGQLEASLSGNEEQRLETIPRIRAMIEKVIARPNPSGRGIEIEVVRRLDEILAIATGARRAA